MKRSLTDLLTFILHPSSFDLMTPEQWQRVEEVLQGALDCSPSERASFIDEACAGDESLRVEATSLVNAHDAAGDFIEEPALLHDANILVAGDLDEKIGSQVGPYTILERLGVGGMGVVYLAQDTRLERQVALKMLPAYFASDDMRLRRFQREARAASSLNHPNILTIHEVGESDEVNFIAAEFIDGKTIRELTAEGPWTIAEILNLAEQMASALAVAHAEGIVHRDIKPENIMRRNDGLVKILDFGIAKLVEPPDYSQRSTTVTQTEVGLVMGTVHYMSPEQARGLTVDARTDIWSLGVVLYEMLSRQLPFSGATRMDTMVAILEREPLAFAGADQSSAHAVLKRIISKCLSKEADARYQDANELLADLKSVDQSATDSELLNDELAVEAEAKKKSAVSRRHLYVAMLSAVVLISAIAGTSLYRRLQTSRSGGEAQPASKKLYTQMSEAEQLNFVRDEEQRISAMMGDRPVKLNDEALRAIKRYVDYYAARDGRPDTGEPIRSMYARAPEYVPLIADSFKARKVPVIIGIYLPMIESAYRPCYENNFGSKGLFQFLPHTAKLYGVSRDEMCDVKKMTPAAAHYIADHMAELGDDAESMTLVLLSYNRGAQWVRDTLRELRETDDYERNFWTMLANRDKLDESFRNESAAYVPNFFAAAIIGENPERFDLQLPPLSSLANQ